MSDFEASFGHALRRSRRIAEMSANRQSDAGSRRSGIAAVSYGTRAQGRQRRSLPSQRPRNRVTHRQHQSHSQPPSGEFTFRSTEPPVPLPGFSTSPSLSHRRRSTDSDTIAVAPSRNGDHVQITPLADTDAPLDAMDEDKRILRAPSPLTVFERMKLSPQSPTLPSLAAPPALPSGAVSIKTELETALTDVSTHMMGELDSEGSAISQNDIMQTQTAPMKMETVVPLTLLNIGVRHPVEPQGGVSGPLHVIATGTAAPQPFPQTNTIRAPQPLPGKSAPPPACPICLEGAGETTLIKACKHCSTSYCTACLYDMFESAIHDNSRMPPRCCAMIQLHIGLPLLDAHDANAFRASFEEWLAVKPMYCPVPACSAFISKRFLKSSPEVESPKLFELVKQGLPRIFQKISSNINARLFDGPIDREKAKMLRAPPVSLSDIRSKLSSYTSLGRFISDFNSMLETYRSLHPDLASVKPASRQFRTHMFKQLDEMAIDLGSDALKHHAPVSLLACPRCCIAICVDCRKVAHPGKVCDTTEMDYEEALLKQYHYRRCPKCNSAVKRMYGCSHIECFCGAHWCYHCQRPINECGGSCDRDDDDETDEDGYSSDDMYDDEDELDDADIDRNRVDDSVVVKADGDDHSTSRLANTSIDSASLLSIADLDAGGARRWAEAEENFGEEPNEDYADPWSCKHKMRRVRADGSDVTITINTVLECNRCFAKVKASYPRNTPVVESASKVPTSEIKNEKSVLTSGEAASKDKAKDRNTILSYYAPITPASPKSISESEKAWECKRCNILCCKSCLTETEREALSIRRG